MSYNGSGTFNINTTGQPVVAGTVITASAFNSLTNDLATGLTTAITKDGQTTTTARITFAQGITSSLTTDSSSVSTGSIITDGGVGIAKNLYVGGTLNVTGSTSLTNPVINNIKMGYTTTATAAGTTTLTVSSNYRQFFTGTTTQTIVLPVTSTLVTGIAYEIENNSTGLLTVNSSGGNLVGTVPAGVCAHAVCIGTTLTTAADWDWDYISTTTITGTGANVLGTSPTITTPTISSLSSAAATALTLQSAGTTAITVDTSQNVGIGGALLGSTPGGAAGKVLALAATQYPQSIMTATSGTTGNKNVRFIYRDSGVFQLQTLDDTYGSEVTAYEMQRSTTGITYQAWSTGTAGSNAERMRIDSSGNLLVGTTATASYMDGRIIASSTSANPALTVKSFDATQFCSSMWVAATTGNNIFANFLTETTATIRGSIQYNRAGGLVVYNTTSDYRAKTVNGLVENALAKVALLKPSTGRMNGATENIDFFVAHELQEVVPSAVTGEKDAVNEDSTPKYQMVDKSALIPLLTKAIQELKALNDTQAETINALTARIVALESK